MIIPHDSISITSKKQKGKQTQSTPHQTARPVPSDISVCRSIEIQSLLLVRSSLILPPKAPETRVNETHSSFCSIQISIRRVILQLSCSPACPAQNAMPVHFKQMQKFYFKNKSCAPFLRERDRSTWSKPSKSSSAVIKSSKIWSRQC